MMEEKRKNKYTFESLQSTSHQGFKRSTRQLNPLETKQDNPFSLSISSFEELKCLICKGK